MAEAEKVSLKHTSPIISGHFEILHWNISSGFHSSVVVHFLYSVTTLLQPDVIQSNIYLFLKILFGLLAIISDRTGGERHKIRQ